MSWKTREANQLLPLESYSSMCHPPRHRSEAKSNGQLPSSALSQRTKQDMCEMHYGDGDGDGDAHRGYGRGAHFCGASFCCGWRLLARASPLFRCDPKLWCCCWFLFFHKKAVMECFATLHQTHQKYPLNEDVFSLRYRVARASGSNTASHRIASHRIASHRIASHRIASHRIASHRIASHRMLY